MARDLVELLISNVRRAKLVVKSGLKARKISEPEKPCFSFPFPNFTIAKLVQNIDDGMKTKGMALQSRSRALLSWHFTEPQC